MSQCLSKRRDQLHIANEILKVAKQGAKLTRIIYNANLSFKGVNQYPNFIMENRLLLKTHEGYKQVYYASEKRLNFSQQLHSTRAVASVSILNHS